MAKGKQKGFVNFKQLFLFAKQNYFVTVIALCVLFVGVVAVYKLFFAKPTYVYVKVKVGQGLWWANTSKPSMWFIQAIQNVKEEIDSTGQPIAEILNVAYYPWWGGGQFDVYITVKLRVSKIGKVTKYNFKRATIGIGAPIDFEFNSVQFSGTIIELNEKPINETYIEKTITLTKKAAFPWEVDALQIGDSYSTGGKKMMEIIGKQSTETVSLTGDQYGNYLTGTRFEESKRYLTIKAKVKGKTIGSQFFYAEDQVVIPGKNISIGTANFVFNDFIVAKIE